MASVLVIGNGGREHALAWRLAQSSETEKVWVCPGNGGTATNGKIRNIVIDITDIEKLTQFCHEEKVSLAVIGPEGALANGIVDKLKQNGIPAFGPTQKAAQLETSKAFAKDFMAEHGIPTAAYKSFTCFEDAKSYVESVKGDVVIKASGLAAGKGVLLPNSQAEAVQNLRQIMVDHEFGEAGNVVVVEERLCGPELSVFALCDGYTATLLPACQDHKRLGTGDEGPNTGGMGAYCPAPMATPALMKRVEEEVVKPTVNGMRKQGTPFVGVLFVGVMLTAAGPMVLEYNCRFGDPETQVLMEMLDDSVDLLQVMQACVNGYLDAVPVAVKQGHAVTVVTVSQGYPGAYETGKPIKQGSLPAGAQLFHAGTRLDSELGLVTNGGRVLAATALSQSLEEASKLAYQAVEAIDYQGKYYRTDIAYQALQSKSSEVERAPMTYADAGVDITAGNRLVDVIKPYCKATKIPGCDAAIGGFGGVFDMAALPYSKPLLVAATDGVGTKLSIAHAVGRHDTIGQDLVAMSVNDLLVQGAQPLIFLDYYACGSLDVDVAAAVVKGIAEGCKKAKCSLIGGETAEMPSMYEADVYDLAGFAVGAVEKDRLLPRGDIAEGDVLIGLASSGLHSNGFSLARKVVENSGFSYSSPAPFVTPVKGATLGDVLLEPTTIYVDAMASILERRLAKGMAHITGGGFVENVARVLPDRLSATIDSSTWNLPEVFKWLKVTGNIDCAELARTFNCGIGLVVVVAPEHVAEAMDCIAPTGISCYVIGHLAKREEVRVTVTNMEECWCAN